MNTHFVIIKEDDGKPFGYFVSRVPMSISEVEEHLCVSYWSTDRGTDFTQEEFDKIFIKQLMSKLVQVDFDSSINYSEVVF